MRRACSDVHRQKTGNCCQTVCSKRYGTPNTVSVPTPIFNKKACTRQVVDLPVHLPSTILKRDYNPHDYEHIEEDPMLQNGACDVPLYVNHPVMQKNQDKHWSRKLPVSIFFDGVLYSKRNSFFGFYVRNMRTGIEDMVFIISA